MSFRRRVAAVTAGAAALAMAVSVTTASADPLVPAPMLPGASPNACLSGFADPGPLGPSGPYGASGPYGPNGPMAGRPNPLGNVPQCGGMFAFVMRGDTVNSFVNANLASVGITP
jgi:hypothetical protein